MLSDAEWQQLQQLERQFSRKASRYGRRLARGHIVLPRQRHHRSALRMALGGGALVAAGLVPALGVLQAAGVLLLFSSIVRWNWLDVLEDWRARPDGPA